jgi:anti-sigma B factor antagonist
MDSVGTARRSEGLKKARFNVERRQEGDTTRLILHGELDLGGQATLRGALRQAERSGAALVVVLDQLDSLDSAGIGELLQSAQRARRDGRRFSVTPGAGNVRRVLWISGALNELCEGDPAAAHRA